MPFWIKWIALPIAGIVLFGWIIGAIIHAILGMIVYLALGAVAVGVIMYAYRRFMDSLPAAKRRKRLGR